MNFNIDQTILAAEQLAIILQDCGHDDIIAVDILDALSICGMTLEDDQSSTNAGMSVTSAAYAKLIQQRNED